MAREILWEVREYRMTPAYVSSSTRTWYVMDCELDALMEERKYTHLENGTYTRTDEHGCEWHATIDLHGYLYHPRG